MARVARDLADVAAVDLSLDVQRLQRHVIPVVAAVGAAPHAGASDAEYRAWPPATGQDTVHVDHVVVDVLAVAQILPMLAAISRADSATDLDRTAQVLGLDDASVENQHPLRRVGVRRRSDVGEAHADRQAGPTFARIIAAIDLAIFATDQDHI